MIGRKNYKILIEVKPQINRGKTKEEQQHPMRLDRVIGRKAAQTTTRRPAHKYRTKTPTSNN